MQTVTFTVTLKTKNQTEMSHYKALIRTQNFTVFSNLEVFSYDAMKIVVHAVSTYKGSSKYFIIPSPFMHGSAVNMY